MEKVISGEAVSIKASTWNSFIDAAVYVKNRSGGAVGRGLGSGTGFGIVLVKNTTDETIQRFGALVLSGVCITPEKNEDEFVSCVPAFRGVAMTASLEGRPFGILLEPAEKDAIVRAMVLGVTPASVEIKSEADGYAAPKAMSETGELESTGSGFARILWAEPGTGTKWCLLLLGGGSGGAADNGCWRIATETREVEGGEEGETEVVHVFENQYILSGEIMTECSLPTTLEDLGVIDPEDEEAGDRRHCICLKISGDGAVSVTSYDVRDEAGEFAKDQRDLTKVVRPIYIVDGFGSIVTDLRNAPHIQMTETGLTMESEEEIDI